MTRLALAAELRGVRFAFVRDVAVLTDIDLAIERGNWLAMIGPNGGGKTTLLRLLLGLLEPQHGRIEVFGETPARARRRLAYVPQHASIDCSVPASALDIVLMGRLRRSPWGPRFGRRDCERARASLERVGLSGIAAQPLGELSGGQRQRVLVARGLVGEPEMLLLDEPTSSVDAASASTILTALRDLSGVTIVMASHDNRIPASQFDQVVHVDRRLRTISMAEEHRGDRGGSILSHPKLLS